MGILPLQYRPGEHAESLGLTGEESFSIPVVSDGQKEVEVTATDPDGKETRFAAVVRIDTPNEFAYFRNGGILHYVLRRLAGEA